LLGAPAYWERRPTGSAGFPAGLLGAPAFQPAYWERRLSSRPTGSAGFPAGLLGAPAFQSAYWERRLSSRPRLMRARCPHQAILRLERLGASSPACSSWMELARVWRVSPYPTSLARHWAVPKTGRLESRRFQSGPIHSNVNGRNAEIRMEGPPSEDPGVWACCACWLCWREEKWYVITFWLVPASREQQTTVKS